MSFHPTTELVTVAWLKAVIGPYVATDIPTDSASWAETGFIQVQAVGGTPERDLPVARPVVSVDCWAVNPNSSKPPWNRANALAERLRTAIQDPAGPRPVTLPAGYAGARVMGTTLLTEPRRIRDDDADFAHFQADLLVTWIEVPA